MRYLHLSRQLVKQAKEMAKAGKKGERAIATYEMIIEHLRQADCRENKIFNKRTKKGEQRMKNCVKYDLGGGYRLITVRSGEHLFVPFLGDHDNTDIWFDRHRYDIFSPDDSLYICEEIAECDDETAEPEVCWDNEKAEDIYEEELKAQLDEATLRVVFQGLYNNRTTATDSLSSD